MSLVQRCLGEKVKDATAVIAAIVQHRLAMTPVHAIVAAGAAWALQTVRVE